jgi:protoporphyrinogen oxidase
MEDHKNNTENKSPKVVILGGGPAGLATGHNLCVHGADVTVLERNSFVGGLCRTIHDRGYRFDLGGHRWFTKNEDLNRWFRRLMDGEYIWVDRISRIYYDGKYYMYPVAFGDVIKNAGPLTILHAGFSFVWSMIVYSVLNRDVKHMKDAYTSQFGSKLYDMFFRRYTEKVWGKPCEELSADWVNQRSKGLSIWTVIQDALLKNQKNVTSLIDQFMYPRDGYMRIPERMAEDIEASGNTVNLRSSVSRIVYHGPKNIEVFYENESGTSSERAEHVVSTIPLNLLATIIEPKASDEIIEAANQLEFRDLVTVNLMLKREQVSNDTWPYVQDEDIIFGRFHEPKNWSRAMVPDDEHTSLVLECFCTFKDEIWSLTDEEVGQRCVDDLVNKLKFINRDEVEGWQVVRTRHCYPVYDLEYSGRLKKINEYIAQFEGIHVVGRGGTFRYNNADHSIEMGLLLSQKILGHNVDHMDVNTEQEYQEEIRSPTIERDHFKIEADGG